MVQIREVREGAASLSKQFQRVTFQNDQLRADMVQLRLRAAGAARRGSAAGVGWNGSTGAGGTLSSVGKWRQHEAAVSGVCTAGSLAVACSWDGCLTSFDLASWREGPGITVGGVAGEEQGGNSSAESGPLQAVAASQLENQFSVLAGSEDSRAWLWVMNTGKVQVLEGHEGAINDVAFHPVQHSVACTAADDCRALVWDTSKCKLVRELQQHRQAVTSCKLLGASGGAGAAHDRSIVTASADGHVRMWDLRSPTLLYALPVAASRRVVVDASAASQLLLAASDLGMVSAWDLRTLTRLQLLDVATHADMQSELSSIALSPCCSYLAIGTDEGDLVCYDLRHPTEAERVDVRKAHEDAIFGLAWGAVWPWRPSATSFLLCSSHDHTWSCLVPNN